MAISTQSANDQGKAAGHGTRASDALAGLSFLLSSLLSTVARTQDIQICGRVPGVQRSAGEVVIPARSIFVGSSDVQDIEKLKKDLWKSMARSPFVMVGLEGGGHSEPLTAQLDEDQVDTLWFFVGKDNRLNSGGAAMVQFVGKGHDYFACLAGVIHVDSDRAMIDKLWSKPVQAWFPGGKDDPNLVLLRFDISDAELWEADMSLVGVAKMLLGRQIDPREEGNHARTSTTAAAN